MAMNVDKPMKMNKKGMLQLRDLSLAPYIQLSTELIGKSRHAGGNMFRHQIDTMGILVDYGYLDSVLLKASLIHDLVEDVPGFDVQKILDIGGDAPEVLELVYEVTRKPEIKKPDYLKNIIDKIEYERGSTVRITKENSKDYGIDTSKGLKWYTPPYEIKMKLKYK